MTFEKRRSRYLAGLAIVALIGAVATSCSGDDDGSADDTTAASTTEKVTTTIGTTTTTTAATTTAPLDATTTTTPSTTAQLTSPTTSIDQIDWISIVDELYDRKFDLLRNPDPARAGEVASEGNPAYEALLKNVTDLLAQDIRIDAAPFVAARVDVGNVIQVSADGQPLVITLIVWGGAGSGVVVDAEGNVVSTLDTTPPGTLPRSNITIGRGAPDQPWLFIEETPLAPSAP